MLIECCSITIRHDNRLRKFYLRLKAKKGISESYCSYRQKNTYDHLEEGVAYATSIPTLKFGLGYLDTQHKNV